MQFGTIHSLASVTLGQRVSSESSEANPDSPRRDGGSFDDERRFPTHIPLDPIWPTLFNFEG